MARGYTRKQTGTRSGFGGARSAGARRVLNPWGNSVPAAKGRRANALGTTIGRRGGHRGGAVRRPKPDSTLWSMKYPKNDPLQWPVEGEKMASPSGMTQEKADWNNAVVNHAFKRAGYPEA